MPSLETPSAKKRRARECVPRERAGRCATPTRVPKPSSPSTGNRDTAAALHTWRIWPDRETGADVDGCAPKGHASVTVQARGSRTSTQHVLRRLPHRRRRRRRARAPPRLRQGARFVRAREPRALGFVFPRHASAGLARAARGGGRRDPRARARARGAVLPRAQRRRRGEGRANHRHHHGCVPNANGPPKLGRLPVVIPREAPTWRATATKSRDAHADAPSVSRFITS